MTDSRMEEAFRDFPRIRQLAERAAAHVSRTLDLPRWLERDDLVQEALRLACEAAHRWDPQRARFTTYLYRHLAFFLRREIQRRLPHHPEPLLPAEALEDQAPLEDPWGAVDLHHTLAGLLDRLRAEAPVAFQVVADFYGLGGRRPRSLAQIERRLGLRRGEGRHHLEDGLNRLRRLWQTTTDGGDGPRAAPARGERGRGDPGAGAVEAASCADRAEEPKSPLEGGGDEGVVARDPRVSHV